MMPRGYRRRNRDAFRHPKRVIQIIQYEDGDGDRITITTARSSRRKDFWVAAELTAKLAQLLRIFWHARLK